MPYILILGGFIVLLYFISRLMKQSNSPKLNKIFRFGFAVVMGSLAFLILIRGNVAVAAILGLTAFLSAQGSLWTIMVAQDDNAGRKNQSGTRQKYSPKALPMTREEALDVLGLADNPSSVKIREAHHKLIKKIHPDQGGSDYLAMKINQARDVLLG